MIDKVGGVILKDKKILVQRKKNNREECIIPGGKREGNETDFETLKRELDEELDVELLNAEFLGGYDDIACFSDEHFLIQKSVVGEKTKTDVRLLDEEGKINEVARLLGGDIGSYGILHAKDMLFWANEVKSKN